MADPRFRRADHPLFHAWIDDVMMPNSDQVAWAIVAACRETGDDPIDTATGVADAKHGHSKAIRARHYALHALLTVFPDMRKSLAAALVGAPGKPMAFYNNSITGVMKR